MGLVNTYIEKSSFLVVMGGFGQDTFCVLAGIQGVG